MKSLVRLLIIVFALQFTLDVYAGGGNRTGTGGATQLLIPVGPRGIAMGESNIATSYGVESIFWNPAGAARMSSSTDVLFSHMSYIADIGVEYGAVSANFEGFGVISLSLKSLSIGNIPVTTTENPDGTGATFSPQMLTAGLSYARQLTDRISVGLTANIISETLGDVSTSGLAFNVGVIYETMGDIDGLSMGIVMKNVGPQMQYDGSGLLTLADAQGQNRPPQYYKIESASFDLPSSFEMGLGYKLNVSEINSLQFSGAYQTNNYSGDEYKLGAEYGYDKMFFARVGYQGAPQVSSENYLYGLTAGTGIHYSLQGIAITVDYTYRDAKYFNGNHIFALSLGF
ncbi:MAG: PorV/PorQ family protein [Ignavibacteriaceae bacterium]|nr:PorV/PorQ family protein [Ignavibacteriaceae bacterium]